MAGYEKVVIIGASAGGITAVQKIISGLDKTFSWPVVVVLHVPENLNVIPSLVFHSSHHKVKEALDKMDLEEKSIYLAPGGYHLLIEKDLTFSLSQDAPVLYSRPSIDVAFESGSNALCAKLIGVLLTGANADGARGLHYAAAQGALTLVQDPQEAEVSTMPQAALELFKPDFVGGISQIAEWLNKEFRKGLS